ncbi:(2Fe-2S)-binding protein [Streptomyces lunalinharesii]|uniref:(2Fe-2S)-binding protein n=1 Tax=Streptomyces lunalinharesii TaxID=333384 RepID=A0ABN3SS70_9ACTN
MVEDTAEAAIDTGELPTLTRRRFVGAVGAVTSAAGLVAIGDPADATEPTATDARTVSLNVNGTRRTVELDSRTSLLDMLREELQLTGTRKGCDQGACGACTVLLDGRRINACLTLAMMHDGAELTTIEGLADGAALHPLQQAFIDTDAFQCGYCTSGQIMSGVGCIREGHTGSGDEIREWMSGNICRCGAYPNVVAAIEQAAKGA